MSANVKQIITEEIQNMSDASYFEKKYPEIFAEYNKLSDVELQRQLEKFMRGVGAEDKLFKIRKDIVKNLLKKRKEINPNAGFEYGDGTNKYTLPETERLLRNVKDIERKLINWFKTNKYQHSDHYSVRITAMGKWAVSYSTDTDDTNPWSRKVVKGQREYTLTPEEFKEAMAFTAL